MEAFGDLLSWEESSEGGYSEFDTINMEDILSGGFDFAPQPEPVFRNTMVFAPAPAPQAFEAKLDLPAEYIVEKPSLRRGSSVACEATTPSSSSRYSCGGFTVPEVPLCLLPTHFEVERDIDGLMQSVSDILRSTPGVSFEQNIDKFEWNVYYLNGPSHCKMQVHVYAGFSSGYVVEGNRLNGDSSLFRALYCSLKAELEQASFEVSYDSFTVFSPAPAAPELLSNSFDLHGLGPIFRMAQSPFTEARLEAARTLCELSNEESVRSPMVKLGVVSVLLELLTSAPANTEWVQQHALLALANLSDCTECHAPLIESGLVAMLLSLCCDGVYQTSELRVLGAYILANLCSHFDRVHEVAAKVGKGLLTAWAERVESLTDERVKFHCLKVKEALSKL